MNLHQQAGLSLSPLLISSGTDWFYLKNKTKNTDKQKENWKTYLPSGPSSTLIPKFTWVSHGQEQGCSCTGYSGAMYVSGGGRTEEARLRGCLAGFTLGQAWGQGRGCCTGLWANRCNMNKAAAGWWWHWLPGLPA